jgi:hypothetical protein
MLKHEVGFDVDAPDGLVKTPSPLAPESHHLDWPGDTALKGFTLSRVPLAILSGLATPLVWVGKKLSKLRYNKPPETQYKFTTAVSKFQFEGSEAREELRDALSPIFDQLDMHWYWKVMEWLPCESFTVFRLVRINENELIRRPKGSLRSKAPN